MTHLFLKLPKKIFIKNNIHLQESEALDTVYIIWFFVRIKMRKRKKGFLVTPFAVVVVGTHLEIAETTFLTIVVWVCYGSMALLR